MTPRRRPPRLARRLLTRALPADVREGILGDLGELFRDRANRHGPVRAHLWYWKEAVAFSVRFGWERVRDRMDGSSDESGAEAIRNRGRNGSFFSWLDVKLGCRMLARYPGLTVVGGLALAFAIFVGGSTFELVNQLVAPTLPLPDGERIVGIRYWDRVENEEELPSPEDLRGWQARLRTVQDLGGFRTEERNLAVGEQVGEPVRVARISPVAFHVADVPPLMGRALMDEDAAPDAAPVVVLGHRLWQTRFAGERGIVGRTVRLGEARATVVGVMPEGFGFPKDHNLWTALRPQRSRDGAAPGAPLHVFGRLAPGATLGEAQAELSALTAGSAAVVPEHDQRLTVQVLPHAEALFSFRLGPGLRAMFYQLNVYPLLFLILVAGNVALLIFARAATREREIVVRSALGASRGRIVAQLFLEALLLGGLAVGLGLAVSAPALEWIYDSLREIAGPFPFPFWVQPRLSPTTVAYALVLTLVGAVVAGVVPGLKATGRDVQGRLRKADAGAGGLRLGGVWTGIIVVQIATTVVFAGSAYLVGRQAVRNASVEPFFPAGEYLGARLEMDRESPDDGADTTEEGFRGRYAGHLREVERRIVEHPAVAAVTLANRLPVKAAGSPRIELDEGSAAVSDSSGTGHTIRSDWVDLDFFDVFQTQVISGRGFDSRDLGDGMNSVLVNSSFAEEILEGRTAVGRRIRYLDRDASGDSGPWYEIVGVVRDLVADRTRAMSFTDPPVGRVYHPLDPERSIHYPVYIVVHAPSGPEAVVPLLYETAGSVSPSLRVHEPERLDRADGDIELIWRLFTYLVLVGSGVALVLSLAGIYATMSFTVTRRTREIGIRVALGAAAPRVVAETFRKPLTRVGTGVAIGSAALGVLAWGLTDGTLTVGDAAALLAVAGGTVGVSALACLAPTLRALRIEPTEALRAEG